MAVGAVVARILTQYSDKGSKAAQKDIANLGKKFDNYSKKAVKAFGLVAAAATVAAVKIGKDAVMAASDVSQQFGALDAVFGKNAKELQDFSKSMVDYGLSTADAARYAALLGTQLKGLGLSEQEAIDRTKQLEILASDLAATYGGTTADAVQALSSTFKGEYNPIERYGVAIKKSDITARVAAKGLGKLKGDLLKAAEAQTAFEMIIAKTTAAQGQSRREYNTLAAQLQRVEASYENIKATLGMALLPVVEKFADYVLKTLVPGLEKWVNTNKDQLAKSLQTAAEEGIKLFAVALSFGQWVVTHTDDIKTLSIIMASLWGTSKVYAFAKAIGTVTLAIRGMAAASAVAAGATVAGGAAGAAGVTAAIAGAVPLAIAGGVAALTYGLSKVSPGEKARAKAKTAAGVMGNNLPMSPSAGDVMAGNVKASGATSKANSDLSKILADYQKITDEVNKAGADSKKKELSAVEKMYRIKLKELGLVETTADIEKMATANAIKANLARQAKLSGSRTIAIGSSGSLAYGNKGATTVVVNNAGSVITQENLVTSIVNGIERTTRRSFGTTGAFDR
jgi:hypothetical protein